MQRWDSQSGGGIARFREGGDINGFWGVVSITYILALFIVVGFIGQVAVLFHRMGQAEKRQVRSEERAEKRNAELLAMFDKQLGEVNQQIDGLRSEMNQGFSDVRSEMNQRLSDMDASIRPLNQNHIEHLTHHE